MEAEQHLYLRCFDARDTIGNKNTDILLVVEKKKILSPNEDQICMYKSMSTACIYYQRMENLYF